MRKLHIFNLQKFAFSTFYLCLLYFSTESFVKQVNTRVFGISIFLSPENKIENFFDFLYNYLRLIKKTKKGGGSVSKNGNNSRDELSKNGREGKVRRMKRMKTKAVSRRKNRSF